MRALLGLTGLFCTLTITSVAVEVWPLATLSAFVTGVFFGADALDQSRTATDAGQ